MSARLAFLRPERVEKYATSLAAALGIDPSIDPRRAYQQALESIQSPVAGRGASDGLALLFHGSGEHAEIFAHFLTGRDLPELAPFTDDEVSTITRAVHRSLEFLDQLAGDRRATLDLLVHTLLIVRLPAFGSLSDALGLVMAGPEGDWPALEIAELLWHETVHQALFLADVVEPLFVAQADGAPSPQAYARNPLLGVDRPYDLAFHGTAVSVAILDLHLSARSYQRASELASTLAPALDELAAHRHLLTRRGAEILRELVAAAGELVTEVDQLAPRGPPERGERSLRRSYLDLQPSWRPRS